MALPAITKDDFTGLYKLNLPQLKTLEFDAFIADVYPNLVREFIGNDAYTEIANQDPLQQKWIDLFEGVASYFNTDCEKTLSHDGLRGVCIAGVYFKYVRDSGVFNSPTGNVKNKNGNAYPIGTYTFSTTRYNTALMQLDCPHGAIYMFIENYKSISGIVSSSADNGGGNYTVSVPGTTYLYDGDTVKIGGVEYVVSNVVDNASFDITAEVGKDFTGMIYYYEPYGKVKLSEVDAVW